MDLKKGNLPELNIKLNKNKSNEEIPSLKSLKEVKKVTKDEIKKHSGLFLIILD